MHIERGSKRAKNENIIRNKQGYTNMAYMLIRVNDLGRFTSE